jgi:hypothetical protein
VKAKGKEKKAKRKGQKEITVSMRQAVRKQIFFFTALRVL